MNGVGHLGRDRLVQRDGPRVALNRVMLIALTLQLLSLQLLPLPVFTLSVGHLLLALSLDKLPFPRIPLTLAVDGLGRRVLHRLTDAWQGMTSVV